ncbi:MAG: cupredoxin domain-containing protein [Dehalococcoidia bacterium]
MVVLGASALALAVSPAAPAHATAVSGEIVEPGFNPETWGYAPTELTVQVGEVVSWVNKGDAPHTVTAYDGSFNSGIMLRGEAWVFTPSSPGTYAFYCTLHPSMKSTLVVTE